MAEKIAAKAEEAKRSHYYYPTRIIVLLYEGSPRDICGSLRCSAIIATRCIVFSTTSTTTTTKSPSGTALVGKGRSSRAAGATAEGLVSMRVDFVTPPVFYRGSIRGWR